MNKIKSIIILIIISFMGCIILIAGALDELKSKSLIRNYSFSQYKYDWTKGDNKIPWIKIEGVQNQQIDYSIIIPLKIELIAISPNAKVSMKIINKNCRNINISELSNAFGMNIAQIPVNKFPTEAAFLGEQGFLRFQKYQEIRINPLYYKDSILYFCQSVRIKIVWEDDWSGYKKIMTEEPAFESIYQSAFLNYSVDNGYKARKIIPPNNSVSLAEAFVPPAGYKIKVNEDGIYQLTYQKLAEAGLPVDTIQPRTFQLYNRGKEIAIYVYGEEDNKFDANDYIEFYGLKHYPEAGREAEFEGADYTDDNFYWLYFGHALGKRMQLRDVAPINGYETPPNYWDTITYDPYGYFYSQVWEHGMHHWVWAFELKGPQSQCPPPPPPDNCNCSLCDPTGQKSFTFTLPYVDTSAAEAASFSVKLMGRTGSELSNPDHHTAIHINTCSNQDDDYWDGKINYYHQFNTPHFCLADQNSLTLEIVGDITNPYECCRERVALDSITITYKKLFYALNDSIDFIFQNGNWRFVINNFQDPQLRLYDITDKDNPVFLTNFSVSSNGNWQLIFEDSINFESHYITASDLAIKEPTELIKDNPSYLKNANNRADYLIITDDTFINTESINEFKIWKESLGYSVQLINVTDIFDEFSYGIFDPLAIKLFLEYVYYYWQEPLPSYVLIVGDPTFDYKNKRGSPDWFLFAPTLIGDDPTSPSGTYSSDSSLAAVAGSDILPDFHIARLSVNNVSDLQYNINKIIQYESLNPSTTSWKKFITMVADYGKDFEYPFDDSQENFLPTPPYQVNKLYYSSCQPPYPDPSCMRNGLRESINNGTLIVSFAGHGAPSSWGSVAFWNNQDITNLTNYNKYPLVTNVSCYTAAIHRDTKGQTTFAEVLMEAFMNRDAKGAISSIAPSSSDSTSSVDQSIYGFFEEIFSRKTKDVLIGSIFYKTILDKYGLPDEAKGLVLLGDPSIKLVLPQIDPPQNLTALGGHLKVTLDWDDNIPTVAGYNIYRCLYNSADECLMPDTNFVKINSSPVAASYFEDTDVVNLITYYYYVVAVDEEAFESKWSNVAFATPKNEQPPSPPTGLAASDPKIGSIINLTWNANPEADIEGYQLYIGTQSHNYNFSIWVGNKTNFAAAGLSAYTLYYFSIKAKNTSGLFSDFSEETSAMPTKEAGSQPKRITDLILLKPTPENVLLQWSKPLINEAGAPCNVIAYSVYRGTSSAFVPDHSSPGQTNSNRIAAINNPAQNYYEDVAAVISPNNYYYLVSAYDEDWMESSVATEPPQRINDFILLKQYPQIIFQWSPATPVLNSWIAGYNLYIGEAKNFIPDRANHTNLYLFSLSPPIIDDTLLSDNKTYYFKLLVIDNHGNESIP